MSSSWDQYFRASLDARTQAQGRRYLGTDAQPRTERIIDFGSNDYLGLSSNPNLHHIDAESAKSGSASSPVLLGYTAQQAALERELADLFNTDSAIVFSSGYAANAGVIGCLASDSDLILSDQLNHASLIDGCRLSRARCQVFPHCDAEYVAQYLKRHRDDYQRVLILTETVFSMDGDQAPLGELASIAAQYDAGLVVDEAHALGIYGDEGAGLCQELHIGSRVLLKLGTLSKSAGCVGGYAAGTELSVDYLVNFCRSLIFSTAPSPMVMEVAKDALRQIRSMDQEREALRALSRELRRGLRELGWRLAGDADSDSPIVPVIIGDADKTRRLSAMLYQQGIYVPAIRPPTVPKGTSRLRISLSTLHTETQVAQLLHVLGSNDS
ncbi:MAG: aminotransferase class I/II-fold pyridoxal phosphate-dependent enzyme [Aureliella sp.]